jgi:hypothetical protein
VIAADPTFCAAARARSAPTQPSGTD